MNTMRAFLAVGLWLGASSLRAFGGLFFSQTFAEGFQNAGAIPDGLRSGWNDTRPVSGSSGVWQTTDVQVTLHLSGGYNGDLYAYLTHGDGFAVLLNRVGVGQAQGDAWDMPTLA